jgi:hypothetical protein
MDFGIYRIPDFRKIQRFASCVVAREGSRADFRQSIALKAIVKSEQPQDASSEI